MITYRFAADVTVEADHGTLQISNGFHTLTLTAGQPALHAVARQLQATPASAAELSDVLRANGSGDVVGLQLRIRRWASVGLLDELVSDEGGHILSINRAGSTGSLAVPGADEVFRLSKLAVIHRRGDELVAENPAAAAAITLHGGRAATVLGLLCAGASPASAAGQVPLGDAVAQDVFRLLSEAQIAVACDAGGLTAQDREGPARMWDFHDAALHFRSRWGAHRQPLGGTFQFAAEMPPLPATKPPMSSDVVELSVPDIDVLTQSDRTFTDVLESRMSGRSYAAEPISLEQLSELLFRSARVRARASADGTETSYEMSSRPYPSGGATFDLELYVTADQIEGLERGLYHYDPDAHALERLARFTPQCEAMMANAEFAMGHAARPQVLITVASRFARVRWKYSGMAYATTLRNVGVFYQTVWLVATSMGLACCGLGSGDTTVFAAATGLDPLEESNVGEIALGSAGPGGRGGQLARMQPPAWAERSGQAGPLL